MFSIGESEEQNWYSDELYAGGLRDQGLIPGRGKRFAFSSYHTNQLWYPYIHVSSR
jgi:hypothetical protein